MVYSKPPFGGPEQVLAYLARYTHRVAITNQRLLRLEGDHVIFTWKDYDHGGVQREMSLPAGEFIRRFLLHLLPNRFVRIRYYGLLANRRWQENLALCRQLLEHRPLPKALLAAEPSWQELLQKITGIDPTLCRRDDAGAIRRESTVSQPKSRAFRQPLTYDTLSNVDADPELR